MTLNIRRIQLHKHFLYVYINGNPPPHKRILRTPMLLYTIYSIKNKQTQNNIVTIVQTSNKYNLCIHLFNNCYIINKNHDPTKQYRTDKFYTLLSTHYSRFAALTQFITYTI